LADLSAVAQRAKAEGVTIAGKQRRRITLRSNPPYELACWRSAPHHADRGKHRWAASAGRRIPLIAWLSIVASKLKAEIRLDKSSIASIEIASAL
jgi:hypothetical protein